MLSIKSPNETAKELANRLRQRRLFYAWSREELAFRSGVNVASIKHFELTGAISLQRFLTLCFTLNVLGDFDQILLSPQPASMQELKKMIHSRKRGRRRSL